MCIRDRLRVLFRIAKAVAEIAAQRGDHQAVRFHQIQEFLALRAYQLFGRKIAIGGIHLDALHAHALGQRQRFRHGFAERIENYANGKMVHFEHLTVVFFHYTIPGGNCKRRGRCV